MWPFEREFLNVVANLGRGGFALASAGECPRSIDDRTSFALTDNFRVEITARKILVQLPNLGIQIHPGKQVIDFGFVMETLLFNEHDCLVALSCC